MEKYYHVPQVLDFQYQLASVSKEMSFRLCELVAASRLVLSKFHESVEKGKPNETEDDEYLKYRFSSVLALLQTFRDVISKAIGREINTKLSECEIPHSKLLRQLRNSLVHDAYQPLGLWVDGRYYIATNYIARDQRDRAIHVDAPASDVETLVLEYSGAYCSQLAKFIRELPLEERLKGPPRNYEWFQSTWSHPAIQKTTGVKFPSREEVSAWPDSEPRALDVAVTILEGVSVFCTARLEELTLLPDVPFV